MATSTTTQTNKTNYTYNKDLSPIASMLPDYQTATRQSLDDYVASNGYTAKYKYDDLYNNVYKAGADAALKQSLFGVDQAQNNFSQSLNATNRSVVDALRSETAKAIASGTSRAISDANVLKSVLGLQQESIADATALAQEKQKAYVDYGSALSNAMATADTESAARQQAMLADTLAKYQTDQQSLDSKYTADRSAYGAAAAALLSQVLGSTTTQTESSYVPDVTTPAAVINPYANYDPSTQAAKDAAAEAARKSTRSKKDNENLPRQDVPTKNTASRRNTTSPGIVAIWDALFS